MEYLIWNADPVLVELGPLQLRWYGLLFVGSFFIAAIILSWIYKREGKDPVVVDNMIIYLMVGAVIGLALFSTLLSWLLEHHHDVVLAALIGLMIGSVRVLWPWPNGVGIISDVEEEVVTGTDLGWADSFGDFLWPTLLAAMVVRRPAGYAFVLRVLRHQAGGRWSRSPTARTSEPAARVRRVDPPDR